MTSQVILSRNVAGVVEVKGVASDGPVVKSDAGSSARETNRGQVPDKD